MRVLAGSCTQNSTPFHIFSFFMKTHSGNISLAQKIQYTCDRIIYAMCGCHGNLYAVMKEIMRRREGLELGGVRPPLPGLAAGDSPKVDQCARMIDEAIETYCK